MFPLNTFSNLCIFFLLLMIYSCRRMGGRDGLLLRGQGSHLRKARFFERIYLPHLWTRRPFGVICITWGLQKSRSHLPERHGPYHRVGILHQLVYGKALSHALVGLQQEKNSDQRAGLPAQQCPVRPSLRTAVPCGESARDGHGCSGWATPTLFRRRRSCSVFI